MMVFMGNIFGVMMSVCLAVSCRSKCELCPPIFWYLLKDWLYHGFVLDRCSCHLSREFKIVPNPLNWKICTLFPVIQTSGICCFTFLHYLLDEWI